MPSCPICQGDVSEEGSRRTGDGKEGRYFSCVRCGDFFLGAILFIKLEYILKDGEEKVALLSFAVRRMQRQGNPPFLDEPLVESILKGSLPSPSEQASNFILWLGENVKGPGETIWVEPSIHQSIMGAKSPDGFGFVIKHLFDRGLVTGNLAEAMGEPGRAYVTLSFDGWDYYDQLKRGASESRKAFMAMKFGDSILDRVVEEVFKPAVEKTGFDLRRLNDVLKAGLIDDRLRVEIRTSRFLIADLTHENPGSYWEAGYAEGLGKPVIYTCEHSKFEKDKTHFDTNHHLTVLWQADDPKATEEALKATIRATLPEEARLSDD